MDEMTDGMPPAEWLDLVERGRADVEAGRVVPTEDVIRELRLHQAALRKAAEAAAVPRR